MEMGGRSLKSLTLINRHKIQSATLGTLTQESMWKNLILILEKVVFPFLLFPNMKRQNKRLLLEKKRRNTSLALKKFPKFLCQILAISQVTLEQIT
jgi:hypothetical protein